MANTCFLCKLRSDKLPRRSFHKFPSDNELKQKWLNILGKSNVLIGRRTTLCSLHFDESCFRYGLVNGRRLLKDGSLPTLHLTKGDIESQTTHLFDKIVLSSSPESCLILGPDHDDANSDVEDMPGTSSQNVGLDHDDAKSDVEDMPGTSSQNVKLYSPSGNEIEVYCPKCNTEVPHTAEGIQEDQTKILIAKVYHYFEHEYEELKKIYGDLDLTPFSKFRQRTALATGVSETMVLQILKEEERWNADKLQELPEIRRRARKRSRQADSSNGEDSSDNNVDDGGQSNFVQVKQNGSEIETLVVKLEPLEYYNEQSQIDPVSAEVKAEPPDDYENKSGLLGETEVKVEKIEIGEEGFN